MGAVDNATAKAKEAQLQAQLGTEKAAMVAKHKAAELADAASQSNPVMKFASAAGRKSEEALFAIKEATLNMPGCASGRAGCISVKAKAADVGSAVKDQTKKLTSK